MKEEISKDRLKELYISAIKKWQDIKDEEDDSEFFQLCAFCEYARLSMNIGRQTISGDSCSEHCPINKDICGSKGCLLMKLERLKEDLYDADDDYNIIEKAMWLKVDEIIEALEKELRALDE